MEMTVIQTRVDVKLKKDAESTLTSIGIDMTSAIRLFLTQVVNQRCIPFSLVVKSDYNQETLDAAQEAMDIADGKKSAVVYSSLDEACGHIAAESPAKYGK